MWWAITGCSLHEIVLQGIVIHSLIIISIYNNASKWEAIKAQFVTAIAAFLGTFLGLYAQKNEFLEKILLATTSGGFLYIATVGILPAVINRKSTLIQIFLECVGFSLGVGFMIVVACLEEIHE